MPKVCKCCGEPMAPAPQMANPNLCQSCLDLQFEAESPLQEMVDSADVLDTTPAGEHYRAKAA